MFTGCQRKRLRNLRSVTLSIRRATTVLAVTLSVVIAWQLFCSAKANAESSQLPNIIFMMADDMGMGDTSAYQDITNNSDAVQVKTPAMERLARMGIRFTDAHAPSSRCTATRQALLTGRYTWRTRLKYSVLWGPQGDPLIEPKRPTLATLLRESGYRTGMSGKWHVGLTYRRADGSPASTYDEVDLRQGIADGPLNHGFDFFHGTSRSHPTSKLQGWLMGEEVPAATGPQQVDRSQYLLNKTGPTNYEWAKPAIQITRVMILATNSADAR
jgi:arylsulfatase A-like enzyme